MAKILLMATSLRKESFNKKLIENANRILNVEKSNHSFEVIQFNDYPLPVYDGDLETQSGLPENVKKLTQKISEFDAVIFSTPEYNGSIPGPFKNAIDWLSRVKPASSLSDKHTLLLAASPGALGGVRGLWHSRVPLEASGMHVFPEMFGLSAAHNAFDEKGTLKDAATEERLKKLLFKFCDFIK